MLDDVRKASANTVLLRVQFNVANERFGCNRLLRFKATFKTTFLRRYCIPYELKLVTHDCKLFDPRYEPSAFLMNPIPWLNAYVTPLEIVQLRACTRTLPTKRLTVTRKFLRNVDRPIMISWYLIAAADETNKVEHGFHIHTSMQDSPRVTLGGISLEKKMCAYWLIEHRKNAERAFVFCTFKISAAHTLLDKLVKIVHKTKERASIISIKIRQQWSFRRPP